MQPSGREKLSWGYGKSYQYPLYRKAVPHLALLLAILDT